MQCFRSYTLRVYSDPPYLSTLSLFLFRHLKLGHQTSTALLRNVSLVSLSLCLLVCANISITSVPSGFRPQPILSHSGCSE